MNLVVQIFGFPEIVVVPTFLVVCRPWRKSVVKLEHLVPALQVILQLCAYINVGPPNVLDDELALIVRTTKRKVAGRFLFYEPIYLCLGEFV